MNELEIPEWLLRIRKNYEADPVKWMWIGMTVLVLVIIAVFATYMVRKQKAEASELLTNGLQALDAGEFQSAWLAFQKIESAHKLSGYRDEARLYSAAAMFGLGKYDEAEAAYKAMIESDPRGVLTPQAELSLGACLEMKNDPKGALEYYRGAREKYKGAYIEKAFEIRIARLSRMLGDAETPAAIYDRLEKDTDGLWKEIARGNRRMIISEIQTSAMGELTNGAVAPSRVLDTAAGTGAEGMRSETSGR
ncbi:MAG: tetratricopeptide repeat protein [Candidatus Hydrogenedentota bacterium]